MSRVTLAVLALLTSACATERSANGAEVLSLTGATVAQRLDSGTVVLQITEGE